MKNTNINNWNSFSRGLCVALLAIAGFCGICGFGAAFSQIPWLLIAGGVCLLLIVSAVIWFLGYKSKYIPKYAKENLPEEIPADEASQSANLQGNEVEVVVRKVMSSQEFTERFDMFNSTATEQPIETEE